MRDWQSLSHVKWDCKYHVVFVTKYRHQTIYGKLRRIIGGIIRDHCRQKGLDLPEGHAMQDYVHLCLSIPPKYSVSNTIGFIKGKSAIRIHRELLGSKKKSAIRIHRELLGSKKMTGLSFWAKGYCASTVGLDEETIRKYIREQDQKH
jgi:putative transposase